MVGVMWKHGALFFFSFFFIQSCWQSRGSARASWSETLLKMWRFRFLALASAVHPLCLSLCFLKLRKHPFYSRFTPTVLCYSCLPQNTQTHTLSSGSPPSAPPPSYKQLIFCSSTALMDALRLEASQPRDIHLLACHTPARQKIFVMCTPIFLQ